MGSKIAGRFIKLNECELKTAGKNGLIESEKERDRRPATHTLQRC